MRNSNTVAGSASIRISRRTTSAVVALCATALLLGFDLALELLEAVAPEVVEERTQLDQALGADAVDTSSTVTTLADQPRAVQDAQVLGDRLPGDVEVRGDRPRGHLLVADQSQDFPPPRFDYGLDRCLHTSRQDSKAARRPLRKRLPADELDAPRVGPLYPLQVDA